MSQENVEIVRRYFDVFNQGGVEAVISGGFWSPEVVWDTTASGIPGIGVFRGYDEIRSFFEDDWFQTFPFEEWEIEVEELIDLGDKVLVISRQRGRGVTSGVGAELEQAHIVTLRDGQVVRAESYLDRAKARKAAGLRE
jgi:ketosteroid isomerase-like protein